MRIRLNKRRRNQTSSGSGDRVQIFGHLHVPQILGYGGYQARYLPIVKATPFSIVFLTWRVRRTVRIVILEAVPAHFRSTS